MIKTIVNTLAIVLFVSIFPALAFWLGPLMLTSGRPELILLAWLLPFCWLIGGLLAYIAWADSGWREDWHASWQPPEPQHLQAYEQGELLNALMRATERQARQHLPAT